MTIITYIYQDFANNISSTHEFRRSVDLLGLPLVNVGETVGSHVGNGQVLRLLLNAYRELDGLVVYADGADSFFLRPVNVPSDRIIYSTEKAIWPPVPELIEAWAAQPKESYWCYLNGGGYCGPAKMLVEYFERYGLAGVPSEANGQWQQSAAYMKAKADGYPIELDQQCAEFQTIGFLADGDFSVENGVIKNNLTGTTPALFHGNGRTEMGWVYATK